MRSLSFWVSILLNIIDSLTLIFCCLVWLGGMINIPESRKLQSKENVKPKVMQNYFMLVTMFSFQWWIPAEVNATISGLCQNYVTVIQYVASKGCGIFCEVICTSGYKSAENGFCKKASQNWKVCGREVNHITMEKQNRTKLPQFLFWIKLFMTQVTHMSKNGQVKII